jgi:mannose-1-phosphate guanylyltransferase
MPALSTPPWALILAGGDGTRLRPLTTRIVGDARPKQFCPILTGETLLESTRHRVELLVPWPRHLIVVSRPHQAYYSHLATELAPGRLVVQPQNRGTGAGIVYSLLRLTYLVGDAPVAIFPSDHGVSDDRAFIGYVRRAVEVVHARRDIVVLLGVEAAYPETDYGWIEPGDPALAIEGEPVLAIRRFWEKPSPSLARLLFEKGYLWNTFIMVGWVSAFLDLVRETVPELAFAFEPVRRTLGSAAERPAVEQVYAELASTNFSDCVLARAFDHLATVRVKGVAWTDLGSPERLIESLRSGAPRSARGQAKPA